MIVSVVFFARFNRATYSKVDLCFPNATSIFPFSNVQLRKFYFFSQSRLSNSIKHEHSCKILYISNRRSTHERSSISATREALIEDPLYLQKREHSCKILSIRNKGNTHVRCSISATRGSLI